MSLFYHRSNNIPAAFYKMYLTLALVLLAGGAAGCDSGPPKESISGTIRLSPSLTSKARRTRTLYIILDTGPGRPPLAVQRLIRVKFPYEYVLTKDDMMFRGRPFSGKVRVRARLDSDGRAGPLVRGDYEGKNPAPVSIGARNVDVLIETAGTAVPPRRAKRPATPPKRPSAPVPPARRPVAGGPDISGTIKIAPRLAKKAAKVPVLFIIARTEKPGPPLAVVKVANPRFPFSFTISSRDVMVPGLRFEGRVRITARLDADGNAGRPVPGDMEGRAPGLVPVGAKGVVITVDRAY